jgi:hypothetical protein
MQITVNVQFFGELAMAHAIDPVKWGGRRVETWKAIDVEGGKTDFADAVGTKGEFVLNFGVSLSWERMRVVWRSTSRRIVLWPFAAKPLNQLLSRLTGVWENR